MPYKKFCLHATKNCVKLGIQGKSNIVVYTDTYSYYA